MDEPVRNVILVASGFQVRGSSSYTLRLAESLERFGFDPTILTPNSELIPDSVRRGLDIVECSLSDSPLLRPVSAILAARDVAVSPHPAVGQDQAGRSGFARKIRCEQRVQILIHEGASVVQFICGQGLVTGRRERSAVAARTAPACAVPDA